MRLGIDFGTTRVVVAAADRGNYPVVSFECPDGAARDWFPPLIAVRGEQRRYGWEAWAAQEEPGWTIVRSFKRILSQAGLQSEIEIGGTRSPLWRLLRDLLKTLARELREKSNLGLREGEPLEVMLGVPANSNTNQRFLTAEMFRLAGFDVAGILNEPSAASIEFGHSLRAARDLDRRASVLVYDLGGGTFDASVVQIDNRTHTVIASEGLDSLGGDDFDEILATLALKAGGITPDEAHSLSQAEHFRLHEECRCKKEELHPNTRRIVVDLEDVRSGWGQATVPVSEFYEACMPLIDETFHTVEDLLDSCGMGREGGPPEADQMPRLEALYVTGGGSEMPLVARSLRERFGKRVRRSAYARSATAIGLAIQAGEQSASVLRDRFTRHFGVWREAQSGSAASFDPLFSKGTALPGPGEPAVVTCRRYSPVHNVGHFRYLECSRLGPAGEPSGDIAIWDEVRFPFDPELQAEASLDAIPVEHSQSGPHHVIEEAYSCDSGGGVTVRIADQTTGFTRQYRLARWSGPEQPLKPGVAKRARR
jgi:molecular chaperone DnaK (HSP70)